jgi:chromosome segregation ATPase
MTVDEIAALVEEKVYDTDIPRYGYFGREIVLTLLLEVYCRKQEALTLAARLESMDRETDNTLRAYESLAADFAGLKAECSKLREENEFLQAHIVVAEHEAQVGFDSLNHSFTEVVQENAGWREELKNALSELDRLRAMEQRVKEGHLTEEEFQAMCHNLCPDDEERFKAGCRQTWEKLFHSAVRL